MDENLLGRTTRVVAFIDKAQAVVTGVVRKPAGTVVYATPIRGGLRIRVPWTLLEQDVRFADVAPE